MSPKNPATTNINDIVLYDLAFQYKESLAQIISHELSHVIYSRLGKEEKKSFRKAADWIESRWLKNYYSPNPGKTFIQPDSKTSIGEDFANHIEFYLFKQNFLKKESLKTYKWIQNKFGNDFIIKKVD